MNMIVNHDKIYVKSEYFYMQYVDNRRLVFVVSGRIPCPFPGRIWLEQRGFQRAMYWHIEARVVLDLQEFLNSVSTFLDICCCFFFIDFVTAY